MKVPFEFSTGGFSVQGDMSCGNRPTSSRNPNTQSQSELGKEEANTGYDDRTSAGDVSIEEVAAVNREEEVVRSTQF